MALVKPHGSGKKITGVMITGEERNLEIARAREMRPLQINAREAGDIIMLGMGAFSPLTGFMGKGDWLGVLEEMKLREADPGTLWPLPITLSTNDASIKEGDELALYEGDELMGTMEVREVFEPDKRLECVRCFMGQGRIDEDDFWRDAEEEHPGVQQVLGSGKYYLGGPVKALSEKNFRKVYGAAYVHPADCREIFESRGWSAVVAFQARHPIHRSQEYCCKAAQEFADGLFIHAVVGNLIATELPGEVRIKCYKALVDNYFNAERTFLGVYPMDMRYGGPREALLHAIIRQNFGCSHLIVGRDHAGVSDFYGLFEAQTIFDTLWDGALELQPLKIDWMFWSKKNDGMASLKTCPADDPSDRIILSGTKFRRMISEGNLDKIPREFSRPEVLEILVEYYAGLSRLR